MARAKSDMHAEDMGWLELRRNFGLTLAAAGLGHAPLEALIQATTSLLSPVPDRTTQVSEVALELARAMTDAGVSPAQATIDGILTTVVSGHSALLGPGEDDQDRGRIAAQWKTASRLGAAVLAQQLSDTAAKLEEIYGPAVLGGRPWQLARLPGSQHASGPVTRRSAYSDSEVVGEDRPEGVVAGRFHEAAATYVRWQQHGVCLCTGGPASAHRAKAERHHLDLWRPGQILDAVAGHKAHTADLGLWFRTWVQGQQGSRGEGSGSDAGKRRRPEDRNGGQNLPSLKAKAFAAGLFYRHFLPSLTDASLAINVADVLEECCIERSCARLGQRAYRYTTRDRDGDLLKQAADNSSLPDLNVGQRRCLESHDHGLDFTNEKRLPEIILVSTTGQGFSTHEFHNGLGWDATSGTWNFVATGRTSTKWLPLPHADAWNRIVARATHRGTLDRTAPVAWRPPVRSLSEPIPRSFEASSPVPAHGFEDVLSLQGVAPLPAHIVALLGPVWERIEEASDGTEFLQWIKAALIPTGAIDVDSCSRCEDAMAGLLEGTEMNWTGDYCRDRLEFIVSTYLGMSHEPTR